MLLEVWDEGDARVVTLLLAGPAGDTARAQMPSDARLLWTVEADSERDAFAAYQAHCSRDHDHPVDDAPPVTPTVWRLRESPRSHSIAEMSYWLAGEVAEIPPLDHLMSMRARLSELGLLTSDRVTWVQLTDTGGLRVTRKSWSAALKGLRLPSLAYDGYDDRAAGFMYTDRLLICRIPSDYPDAAEVAWDLAAELYGWWQPLQFYGALNVRHQEPYILQHSHDLIRAPWWTPGAYGYSWITSAKAGTPLAARLTAAADESASVTCREVAGGVLARLRPNPTLIDADDQQLWREALKPYLKPAQSPPTPRDLVTGPNKNASWVIWDR